MAPPPQGGRNYPLNCWWVAALADEVGQEPLARWLLDTPVVLYRGATGEVIALEDRCPHRQAPLSAGKVEGDVIECPYHGFRFGPGGRCVHVPSMASPPPIRVESYPVREIGPIVWIYLGDQQRIDQVPPPPQMDWTTDPAFVMRKGVMPIAANYLLLKENVLDLTHLGYVHAASFGIMDWVNPPEVTVDGDRVTYTQDFVRSPLAAGYAMSLGLAPGMPWNRHGFGTFLSPAAHESGTVFFDPDQPDVPGGQTFFAHLTTPVDAGNMLYFFVAARDFANDAAAMDHFAQILMRGFREDEEILSKVQALSSRQPRRGSRGERSVKADAAGVAARRIVDRWMARETIDDGIDRAATPD
ncbi:aromatic ring-hydroxylating dioxygenase subunit alpha [Novosphingobium sp. MMS21-SN21R]|uniref:aromatic ring-hydroxylating dioxygenase subunit alpha n=1 Tax=Novosphingobium sp. MMS21-SN21R TaxID=2969298 RepID=UPI0028850AB9|nr:aromatic ring-hydroxylating dioxygenase subunit alpha [Novosphingobium sp. MMS21-SN21R]MDT0510262.1 aromatic ring-hydroxylating dioxygenase subunit alpha [Novosphingobium sp. MMS21-SN21R]